MPPQFTDDKAPICIPFILDRLRVHHQGPQAHHPFVVGLNGLQGVGKTTLVALLTDALEGRGVPSLVCSIDDFYLTREDQVTLARENPDNALWQHRGEPGTHDIPLAKSFFTSLLNCRPASLPQYDKAAYSGQGDRLPPSHWKLIPSQPKPEPQTQTQTQSQSPHASPPEPPSYSPPLQVIILEGWCVGFRPLPLPLLQAKYRSPSRTLHHHRLEHLLAVNGKLADYDAITDLFDAFIHIDAEDLEYVYDWRQEQEEHLRETRGDPAAGMSSEQVIKFVDAYFPGYELYVEGVRNGVLVNRPGSQLRLVVGRDRKVKQVVEI